MSTKRILVLLSALLLGFAFTFVSFAQDADQPKAGTNEPVKEQAQPQPEAQAQASACEKFDSVADGFWCEHCNAEVPADHVDKDKDGKEVGKAVPAKFGVQGDKRVRLEEKDGALLVAGTDKKVCPVEAAKTEEPKADENKGDDDKKANGDSDENKGSDEAPAPKSDSGGDSGSGD